jgi:hypothetical protein
VCVTPSVHQVYQDLQDPGVSHSRPQETTGFSISIFGNRPQETTGPITTDRLKASGKYGSEVSEGRRPQESTGLAAGISKFFDDIR